MPSARRSYASHTLAGAAAVVARGTCPSWGSASSAGVPARVLRDGAWTSIDAADLVPGDVVNVSAGQIVPADLLLIEGEYLTVDQSALTGESLPVSKKVGDAAYSGGIAKQGDMTGVVTKTGNATFFGRTAKLVASAGAVSHSQKAVLQIGDFLILDAVRNSNGFAMAVEDAAITAALEEVAKEEGFLMCPEGAATYAAWKLALKDGRVKKSDRVVLWNCAAGLKYPMPDGGSPLDRHGAIDYATL